MLSIMFMILVGLYADLNSVTIRNLAAGTMKAAQVELPAYAVIKQLLVPTTSIFLARFDPADKQSFSIVLPGGNGTATPDSSTRTGRRSIDLLEGISAGERKRSHILPEGGEIVNANGSVGCGQNSPSTDQ